MMNRKIRRAVLWVSAGSALLFLIVSCTSVKGLLHWKREGVDATGFFSAVRSPSGNPDSHYLLAGYYQERERHREAIEEFRKVLFIDPSHVKAHNGIGISYDSQGDFTKAVESYENALRLNPNLDYVQNNLGYSYLLQGNLDKAIAAFQKAAALNPQEKRFHNNLGLAYAENGQFERALVEFKKAGDESKAHYNLARLYFRKGRYQEARSHYAIALNLNPSSTLLKTGLDAAEALARIFQSTPEKMGAVEVVIPDPQGLERKESDGLKVVQEDGPVQLAPEAFTLSTPSEPFKGMLVEEVNLEQPEVKKVAAPEETKGTQSNPQAEHSTIAQPDVEKLSISDERGKAERRNGAGGVTIEISNGNGVNQMARRVGDYLTEKGLKVIRFTNANRFTYGETVIFYRKGHVDAANQVAEYLPVFQEIREVDKLDRQNIAIKVLIGKDLISQNKLFVKKGS